MKADEFKKNFDENKNITEQLDLSKLRRPKQEQKIRLQNYLFPEGIIIQNNILRTTQINPILKALEEYKDLVINSLSGMVAHRGLEPLFLP